MSKIKITDLEEVSSVTEEGYYIPVDDGTKTVKISIKNYNSSANTTAEAYATSAKANADRASTSASEARSIANEVSNNTSNAESAAAEAAESAKEAKSSIQGLQDYVDKASASSSVAQQAAKTAENYAGSVSSITELSKSWAVGGTGQRADEDTNNAKYWAQKAQGMLTGVTSFNGRWGDVMPQKGDYTPEMLEIVTDSTLDKTSEQPIQNKPVAEAVETINTTISEMKQSFTDGCNTLVNKLKELGVTPSSSSPTDIAAAIEEIYNNRYTEGKTAGITEADARVNTESASYTSGRTQGQTDVVNNPNTYSLYTEAQFNSNYTIGRAKGREDVTSSPSTYSLYTKAEYDTNYTSGRTQGQTDVTSSPSTYGLYTETQYTENYTAGRTQGQADVTSSPNTYNLYTKTQYDDSYNSGYTAGKSAISGSVSASTSWSGTVEGEWQGCKAGTYGSLTVTASISGGKISVSASGSSVGQSWPWLSGSFPDTNKVECSKGISTSNSKQIA